MMKRKSKSDRDGIARHRGKYRISYTDAEGHRRRLQTSAQTLTQARTIRNAKMLEVEHNRAIGYTPPAEDTMAEFAKRYLSHQEARLTPKAYERTKGIVNGHITPALGDLRVADVRKRHIIDYVTARSSEVAAASVAKEVHVLTHMFAVAVERGLVEVNPALKVKTPRVQKGRLRYLQPTEIRVLLAECAPWLQPLVLLLLSTGMRRGELLGLRWMDVDAAGQRILLPQTKNGEGRIVQLNALARAVLARLLPPPKGAGATDCIFPTTMTPERVSLAFLRACRRAKIEDFHLHDLRHTCASWMAMRGEDIYTVSKLLGHKNVRTTQIYAHLSPAHLQAAVERLDGVFGPELALPSGADREPIEQLNRAKQSLTGIRVGPTERRRKSLIQKQLIR